MIKCRVFRGQKYMENGKIKFLFNGNVEKGTIDYFDEKAFEMNIKKNAFLMGLSIDALDENDNVYWSNYQDVKEIPKEEAPDIEELKQEYFELSGEEAKGNWGVPKLTKEIETLKEK